MLRYHCIWFTIDSSELVSTINRLAKKYDAPIFKPHCTLVGKTDIDLSILKNVVMNLSENMLINQLHSIKIRFSDNIWRSLYIELVDKQLLTRLHRELCDKISVNYQKEYLPHISLIYKSIMLEDKRKIAKTITLKPIYKVNSVSIMSCGDNIEDWKPVFKLNVDNLK